MFLILNVNEVTYASNYNKQKTVYTVDLKHIVKTKTVETKFEFNIKNTWKERK